MYMHMYMYIYTSLSLSLYIYIYIYIYNRGVVLGGQPGVLHELRGRGDVLDARSTY